MSFGEFFSSIRSAKLKNVARHWDGARRDRVMPGWNNIQPSQIVSELPLIWVYKYEAETGLFTGRLAGHLIEQVFGKSFRGIPMSELYPANEYPRLHARAKRVACEPALFLGSGMVFKHVERIGQGERIMMPLGDDGVHGDGVFGATVYEIKGSAPALEANEDETWFAV